MTTRLDWYTTAIAASGQQLMCVRPPLVTSPAPTVFLDETHSALLARVLNELAQDTTIPWPAARQAALRAFYDRRLSDGLSVPASCTI
jgi:hypothetical protein